MTRRNGLRWAELRVGLLALSAVIILAGFVFAADQVRQILTPQVRYVTYLPDVAGLQPGSPVRLVGIPVGTVERVSVSEFSDDPTRHAAVHFTVYGEHQQHLRDDSEAYITTEGLLGESVLELTRGVQGEPLAEGGAVPGTTRGSMKQVVQNTERLTAEFHALVTDIRRDPKKYLNMRISLF